MIYLVTGVMRSGTSAMMEALEAGGLPVVKSDERRRLNERFGAMTDYRPNPIDLYEPAASDFHERHFPCRFDGMAIKVVAPLITHLAVHRYRALVMLRSPAEIQVSYLRAFKRHLALEWIEDIQQDAYTVLLNRRDVVDIRECPYEDLVNDPTRIFQGLHTAGWPIDPVRAALAIRHDERRIYV